MGDPTRPQVPAKTCSKCKATKPLEDFYRHTTADGRRSECKHCSSKARRARYLADPEKARAATRAWNAANPERKRASSKSWDDANRERKRRVTNEWAKQNPERVKAAQRAWYAANRERRRPVAQAWKELNRDRVNDSNRAYRVRNAGKINAAASEARRSRRAEAVNRWRETGRCVGRAANSYQCSEMAREGRQLCQSCADHSRWRKVAKRRFLAEGRTSCHLCGDALSLSADAWDADHLIPRALGGTDDEVNLLPAHRTCNQQRSSNTLTPEQVQRTKTKRK